MRNIKISNLKKQAKSKRKNNNNIKNQSDSLNVIAKEKGYKNWQDLLNSAEVKIKDNTANYNFLSKEELESINSEDLKKHNLQIRRQWQNSITKDQTIESMELNEIAFKYLQELHKKIENISDQDWEIVSETRKDLKNVTLDLAKRLEGSEEEYDTLEEFFDYDKKEKIKLKNKFKTMDDYSFYLYLMNSYEKNLEKVPEKSLNKLKIFCPSFIDLIVSARTNNILDINLTNVNSFFNIDYLEKLLWEEKIIKEFKTEILLFLEDIGYQLKTPLNPNPKNSEKILNELNFCFNVARYK